MKQGKMAVCVTPVHIAASYQHSNVTITRSDRADSYRVRHKNWTSCIHANARLVCDAGKARVNVSAGTHFTAFVRAFM